MINPKNLSLQHKFSAITIITVILSLGLACFILAYHERASIYKRIEKKLATQTRITGFNSQAALAFGDMKTAEENLDALRADNHIIAAWIYNKDGIIFAKYHALPFINTEPVSVPLEEGLTRQDNQLSVVQKIVLDRNLLGTLIIFYDLSEIDEIMKQYFKIVFIVMGISSFTAFAIASKLQHGIMSRIQMLANSVHVVSTQADYKVRVFSNEQDELGHLIEGFNQMVEEIQKRESLVTAKTDELAQLNRDLEQRVIERTAELEVSNKELEAFSYSVAHDLRAPLRHIDGFVDLLRRHIAPSQDEKSQRYLKTIGTAAKDMGLLVDHLLVFSRMGKTALNQINVNVSSLIAEIRKELEGPETGRTIEWHIGELPDIEGDTSMMRLVFVNLISNAIKYSRNVPIAIIRINAREINGMWEFSVEDNGAGFDMKYAGKLFGVFQRLHTASEFEGTGIGLANVRRIINRHGGQTWAEGEVNHGAKFFFTLPKKS